MAGGQIRQRALVSNEGTSYLILEERDKLSKMSPEFAEFVGPVLPSCVWMTTAADKMLDQGMDHEVRSESA
jgi:hypothetical protein